MPDSKWFKSSRIVDEHWVEFETKSGAVVVPRKTGFKRIDERSTSQQDAPEPPPAPRA